MKKLRRIFGILAFGFLTSFHGEARDPIRLGLRSGITASTIFLEPQTTDFKPYFYGGIYYDIPLKRKETGEITMTLAPELSFSRMGTHVKRENRFRGPYTIRLDYLTLGAIMKFSRDTDHGFGFETGPQIGRLLQAYTIKNGEKVRSPSSDWSDYDLSYVLGWRYLHANGWGGSLRFSISVLDINKSVEFQYLNFGIHAGAIYRF